MVFQSLCVITLSSFVALPPAREDFLRAHTVQDRRTGLPVSVFHLAVFNVERIPGDHSSVDELVGGLLVVESHFHPYVFKRVGDLAKKPMN